MPSTITDVPSPAGVSASLDTLGKEVGSILIRTPDGWIALPPGPDGYVLTSNGPGQTPSWDLP